MKLGFGFLKELEKFENWIRKRINLIEGNPYEEAKLTLNVRLTWTLLTLGLLYSFTFLYRGLYFLFFFAMGISLCLMFVPVTLKGGFNSTIRLILFFLCGLIFAGVNIFGCGDQITFPILLWILIVIQLSSAILSHIASLNFVVVLIAMYMLKIILLREGVTFPYLIPAEIVNTPAIIDLVAPLSYGLFLFYNSLSLGKKAEHQMQLSNERITKLKNDIAESEFKYRLIVEKSLGYISIHDLEGKLIFINRAASDALGYDVEDLVGQKIVNVIDPDSWDDFPKYLDLIDRKGYAEGIMKVVSREGKTLYWYYRNVRTQSMENQPVVLGFAQDITELEATRKQLLVARQKAEESDKLKSIFLANMSHEIRTPMNAIIGFSELLERSDLVESKRIEFTRHIRERSMDLLRLINDIMDFSRLEAGHVYMAPTYGNLDELLEKLVAATEAETRYLRDKRIEIKKINNLPTHLKVLKLDFIRLYQVLSNLITNALKFTYSGSISIKLNLRGENTLLFSVHDTGEGIPPEKIDVIFKPFRQADDSIHRKYGGSGLGLAICKGITEKWGGRIWVESSLGIGSEFFVTVPFESP